jgi:hypothetical protein
VQLAQVSSAREYVIARVVGIAAETMPGMICIRPIAPAEETARASPALSARITALIQATGTPKRRDASAIYSA